MGYDQCGVCGGNGESCFDCAGVSLGTSEYDICGVCNGDGTSCLDCSGVPNGDAAHGACGVCEGDNSECADCAGIPNGSHVSRLPLAEVDHALLEWSLLATANRLDHTIGVLEGIKEELSTYDVARGNLAADLAAYLDVSTEFLSVVESFVYVQEQFKANVDTANQLA